MIHIFQSKQFSRLFYSKEINKNGDGKEERVETHKR